MLARASVAWGSQPVASYQRNQKPTLYRVGDNVGVPGTIRTYDLQFRKLTLYPTELQAHFAFSFI